MSLKVNQCFPILIYYVTLINLKKLALTKNTIITMHNYLKFLNWL